MLCDQEQGTRFYEQGKLLEGHRAPRCSDRANPSVCDQARSKSSADLEGFGCKASIDFVSDFDRLSFRALRGVLLLYPEESKGRFIPIDVEEIQHPILLGRSFA